MYGPMLKNVHYHGYNSLPFQSHIFPNTEMRQQPFQHMQGMNGVQQLNWDPYMNSYPMQIYQSNQGMDPYYFQSVQGYPQLQQPVFQQSKNSSYLQAVFQNPLQPHENSNVQKQQHIPPTNGYPYMNPYPKGSFISKQSSGMKSVLNSFKSQDGSLDINKMVDTAGQMMNAVSQVSSVVKGFGGMFKA